ncbi:hypothetical protein KDM41_06650 [bacterium]|nr:hypothetical protein [bacterium]
MNDVASRTQTTLLTAHKGVDLHAASALLVMRDRLEGGDRLENLFRCEVHTFWGAPAGWDAARLLDTGRFFNPNKHHFGIFRGPSSDDWSDSTGPGAALAAGWPGAVEWTDLDALAADAAGLYGALLGGAVPAGCTPFDVVGFAFGQDGPVLSGVLWRLVLRAGAEEAAELGTALAVARHRKQGLLINPHMESWRLAARG